MGGKGEFPMPDKSVCDHTEVVGKADQLSYTQMLTKVPMEVGIMIEAVRSHADVAGFMSAAYNVIKDPRGMVFSLTDAMASTHSCKNKVAWPQFKHMGLPAEYMNDCVYLLRVGDLRRGRQAQHDELGRQREEGSEGAPREHRLAEGGAPECRQLSDSDEGQYPNAGGRRAVGSKQHRATNSYMHVCPPTDVGQSVSQPVGQPVSLSVCPPV